MSLYSNCELCDQIADYICKHSNRFLCKNHLSEDQKANNSTQEAAVALSSEEISTLRDTFSSYRLSFILKAIQIRNSRINRLLEQIREAEREYCLALNEILNDEVNKQMMELYDVQKLPIYSKSSLVKSLGQLKDSGEFSRQNIQDLLIYSNSHQFLGQFPSTQAHLKTIRSAQTSSHNISIQVLPSQTLSKVDPPRGLFKQTSSSNLSIQVFPSQIFITLYPYWELSNQTNAHSNWICSLAISDSQEYLATASEDSIIKVWDLQSLNLIRTLVGHYDCVRSVAFLGDKIISGSEDKTIKIWENDQCIKTLNLHSGGVTSVCVSHSQGLLVSGSNDKTAAVYLIEHGAVFNRLKGHSNIVRSVAFSPNDEEIVSGSIDRTIKIWNTDTGELLRTLSGHSSYVYCVSYSGSLILSSSNDKTVKVWETSENQPLLTLDGHTSCVWSVDASDRTVASLGADNRIILWDIRNGRKIQTLEGHGNYSFMSLKFALGGNFIVSGGGDGNIKLWRRAS